MSRCLALFLSLSLVGQLPAAPPDEDQSGQVDDYNQWKQALGSAAATDPKTMTAPPGFRVELLRSAGPQEGSWISMTFDPQGRLIISREDRGLLRLTLTHRGKGGTAAAGPTARMDSINESLLECRGLLWAYDALYANANNSKGLYRLRYDAQRDQFAEPELLRETSGGVGHGRNDLVLGPDGMIYTIHGDDVSLPTDFQPEKSPLQNYSDARLFPTSWDDRLFNASMKLPGGHVVRTDRDGQRWELVAGGLRNPYGLDFNPDGELFTYDADMEWDVGMPWYRPTRVLHLVSGGDYGWRRGTGTWRAWYPESLPAAVDIGLGSPTAIQFGTASRFPNRYRQALFILDWAYGRILAVHLTPQGASYSGSFEPFLSGRPLNVTDLTFGPDGAMYFLTGGRKTQSGLYRVRYVGDSELQPDAATGSAESASSLPEQQASAARQLRRQLEQLHQTNLPSAVDQAWPHLASDDAWIRHAARVAVELQPPGRWRKQALAETQPQAAATALLALARVGTAADREPVINRLLELPWNQLGDEQRVTATRALSMALARLGNPTDSARDKLRAELEPRYPDANAAVNQQLCEILVALDSPHVAAETLPLITAAKTQEEKLHYLFTLRHARSGWKRPTRRTYFDWVRQADQFYGAHYLARYVQWLKEDIAATLPTDEKASWTAMLAAAPEVTENSPQLPRPHVRDWQMDDLVGSLTSPAAKPDLARGKQVFVTALCSRCHRLGTEGSPVGPDLTQVARRFNRSDLLLSILAPSHVIDEKYRATTVVTRDGKLIVGQTVRGANGDLTVTRDLLQPNTTVQIPAAEVEAELPALVSPMPAGLLNSFTKEEILDLLAAIEASAQ